MVVNLCTIVSCSVRINTGLTPVDGGIRPLLQRNMLIVEANYDRISVELDGT